MKYGEKFLRAEPEKYMAIREGWTLRAISLKLVGDRWKMVVAVTQGKNKHVVMFIEDSTPHCCWSYLYGTLTSSAYAHKWVPDKYYDK